MRRKQFELPTKRNAAISGGVTLFNSFFGGFNFGSSLASKT